MTMFASGETAILHKRIRGADDSLGNETWTEVNTTVHGCGFDPGGAVENVQGQDQVITQPTLYMPPGTSVKHVDKITVRGDDYEVDGAGADWKSPFDGWTPGVVIKLKAVSG